MSRPNTLISILRRVNIVPGCGWYWMGQTNDKGYGVVKYQGKRWLVHRLIWTLLYGPIPDGLNVLHHCDEPPCVRPVCLFLGTQADNNADRDRKGRGKIPGYSGEWHPHATLTDAQVAEIRHRRSVGQKLQQLADEFGVHKSTISRIAGGVSRTPREEGVP